MNAIGKPISPALTPDDMAEIQRRANRARSLGYRDVKIATHVVSALVDEIRLFRSSAEYRATAGLRFGPK